MSSREVQIVLGEVTELVSALKRNGHQVHQQSLNNQDPLVTSCYALRDVLVATTTLLTLDCNEFLGPFLDVIRSEETSGPLTGLAISSVNKFLSYNLIPLDHVSASSAVEGVADAITHARFIGTNPANDEVVLMKILQVLRALLLTPVGKLLSNESVCEIMQSCFRICFELRLSDLLRHSAEQTLVDMLQLLFSRLPQLPLTSEVANESGVLMMPTSSPEEDDHIVQETDQSESSISDDEEIANHSVHFALQQDKPADHKKSSPPHDVLSCRELLRFLISLVPYSPEQHHSNHVISTALKLILVTLECGGHHLECSPQLCELVGDQLCYHLFMLMNKTRSVGIFSLVIRNCCLLFRAARQLFKLQLEVFLNKLIDLVSSSEQSPSQIKELALECILQLLSEPNLSAELYVNFDCSLYCSNCFENITKFLAKMCYPPSGVLTANQLLSVDALMTIVGEVQLHCQQRSSRSCDQPTSCDAASTIQPTPEDLLLLRQRKKLLIAGSNQFNSKPSKGIAFLQEQGLLSDSQSEIAAFLHENHLLEKGMLGDYLGDRKNSDILDEFIKQFSCEGQSLLDALRYFLAAFRLPGESPVISRILESFSSHWLDCNQSKWPELVSWFADKDAVFIMTYSIIMLNVDLHNKQVKTPMTLQEFKKNKRGLNGNKDYDERLLDSIYQSISDTEIIMPSEHSGIVMEMYKWKMMLNRQANQNEAHYSVPPCYEHDQDLFLLLWGPCITALSVLFQYADSDPTVVSKCLLGFQRCAVIAAHYHLTDVFDNLIISLCKMSSLLTDEGGVGLAHMITSSNKLQLCANMLFTLCRDHGNVLREGWNNILDCIYHLFSAQLLSNSLVECEDFVNGTFNLTRPLQPNTVRTDQFFFGSIFASATVPATKKSSPDAHNIVKEWNIEQLLHDTKFLHIDALMELVKAVLFAARSPTAHVSLGTSFDETRAIFFQEILVTVALHNKDRLGDVWHLLVDHMSSLLTSSNLKYDLLMERSVVALLRLMDRLLGRNLSEESILSPLKLLYNEIIPLCSLNVIGQVSHGLARMIHNNTEHIRAPSDWSIIFTLIEALLTREVIDEDCCHGNPLDVWITSKEFHCHDDILAVNCKNLSFIVRTNGAVTSNNYMRCVRCVRIVGVVSVHMTSSQSQQSIQILDLLHSLLATPIPGVAMPTKLQIQSDVVLQLSAEWVGLCPLLQGIAHMICRSHKHAVRQTATSYLQRAVLAPQLSVLCAMDWHACFSQVLFPMVDCLLEVEQPKGTLTEDHTTQETLMRVATLLCRVFLQHLVPLSQLDTFPVLWMSLLDTMKHLMSLQHSELLLEAIPESLKNMMLVMTTTGVFDSCHSNLIQTTWNKLNEFVPQLQNELCPAPFVSHDADSPTHRSEDSIASDDKPIATSDSSLNVVIHPPLPSLSPVPSNHQSTTTVSDT